MVEKQNHGFVRLIAHNVSTLTSISHFIPQLFQLSVICQVQSTGVTHRRGDTCPLFRTTGKLTIDLLKILANKRFDFVGVSVPGCKIIYLILLVWVLTFTLTVTVCMLTSNRVESSLKQLLVPYLSDIFDDVSIFML